MICQSCQMKQSPDAAFFRYREKSLCSRCVLLETIGITTLSSLSPDKPEPILAPLFKEQLLIIPPQGILSTSHYLDSVKQQLFIKGREQVIKEKGNIILDAKLSIHKLEGSHFLVSLSGTIAYSSDWEEQIKQFTPPIAIPYSESTPHSPPTSITFEKEKKKEEDQEIRDSAVGKYPDVGGDSQMVRFRQLIRKDT